MNNVYIRALAPIACCVIAFTSALAADSRGLLTPEGQGDIQKKFEAPTDAFDHTRMEVMIPMRDGVKLYTLVLLPKNATAPRPIILTRTPYSAASRANARGVASPQLAMALRPDDEPHLRAGYVRVYQDVRGKHKSEAPTSSTCRCAASSIAARWITPPTPGTQSTGS
jgi:predicted acyl esterase